ncbi:MAG: DUF917 domain-containing protein [Erysipelotrichales bacterium]
MSKNIMIDKEFLKHAVVGATVLGTGGGGDPKIGYLMALQAIEKNGPIPLLQVDDLKDDEMAGCVSMMGAPSVSLEKIPNGDEFPTVIAGMSKVMDVELSALYPIEAGGLNSMIPIVAAANMRLPLLDVDCMGRAFPELQMITQSIFDIDNSTIVLGNEKLDYMVMKVNNPKDMEKYCRSLTMDFGGSAMMSESYYNKETLNIFGVKGIVTKSYEIGKIINESETPVEDMVNSLGAFHLFDGKISDVYRTYEGGFNKGKVVMDSFDNNNEDQIFLQNENLVAFKNNNLIAMVPDLICILDYQTKMPITTETLKFGQRITCIAFPCDEKWRLEKGIELVGPRVFGYDYQYVPIEVLQRGNK